MIEIERKEYDKNGIEYVLDIPISTKKDYRNTNINSYNYNIEDAYNIENINIVDDHSTGLISLLSNVLKTKQQERLIPTDIKLIKSFSGPKCLSDDSVNFDINLIDESIEIDLLNLQINGIPVLRGYKCSGNVSFYYTPEITVLMDNRTTMVNYKNKEASEVVYSILPKTLICKENGELTDWAKQLLPEDANSENYHEEVDEWGVLSNNGGNMYDELEESYIKISHFGRLNYNEKSENRSVYGILAIAPKLNVSKFCILMGIKIGKGGMLPYWIYEANKNYGFDINILNSRCKHFPDIQYVFTNEKTPFLRATGTLYILLGRTWQDSNRQVTIETKIASDSPTSVFIFGSGNWTGQTILLHTSTSSNIYLWYNGSTTAQSINASNLKQPSILILPLLGTSTSTSNNAELRLLGGCNLNNGDVKCSYFKYYENGVLTRFYVPFYEGGLYGMLDLVEDKFYENSGTGSFIYELI